MYSRNNRENFLQQIEIQLSQKPKTFSRFLIALQKSTLNAEYFEKKDDSHSLSISALNDSKRDGSLNV